MEHGFTLVELLVSLAIIVVLGALVVSGVYMMLARQSASGAAQELGNALRLARSDALASQNDAQYGVYLDTADTPNRYVIFSGSSYAARDTSADRLYDLPSSVSFGSVDLGGSDEVVFSKIEGLPSASGSITLTSLQDSGQSQTVYLSSAGTVGFTAPSTPSDSNRVKDSRHVEFAYSRTIDTVNENLVLTFNGNVVQTIPLANAMVGNEIEWQGTVSAGGSSQIVSLQTLRLNNPDTEFDIHRDLRYNNVSLAISLSGDATGDLIDYSADGSTTTATSIYTSSITWQ